MKFSALIRIGAAIAVVAVIAAAGAAFALLHGRANTLGLAQPAHRSPAASPPANDPLAEACPRPAMPSGSPAGAAGLWTVQPGSVVGYRAHEKFAELPSPHEAVARTQQVAGWILVKVSGQVQIETGCIAVDVRTLNSVDQLPGFNTADRDRSARDMLGAIGHPYVIFQPYPAAFALNPSSGEVQHATLAGDLEISGVTRSASFALDLRLADGQLSAAGACTVQVGDFGIEVPEEAGGFVQVDPRITLEISLLLGRS